MLAGFLILGIFSVVIATPQIAESYSLQHPYKPSDNTRWETGAGAQVTQDYIRITPAQPSRSGYVWSRIPVTMTDWEVIVKFSMGSENSIGGEGMAFWFTEKRMLGPVFGSADYWNGLGLFFDTYNNDGQGDSPLILAIYNDGTVPYSVHNDGAHQALGQCYAPALRNRSKPSQAKITYKDNFLTVLLALEYDAGGQPIFHPCISAPIRLGVDKFFGVTASTGHPMAQQGGQYENSDNHDLIELLTFDLSTSHDEKVIERERQAYRREIEEEHKYMPNHHDVTKAEFTHDTLTLLNQVASAMQVLEQSQIEVDNKLRAKKTSIEREKHVENRKDESHSMISGQIAQNLANLADTQARLLKTCESLKEHIDAQPVWTSASEAMHQEWQKSYHVLHSDFKDLKHLMNQVKTPEHFGRSALGGTSTLATAVKLAISSELSAFTRHHAHQYTDVAENLQNFQSKGTYLTSLLADYATSKSSAGGMSWVQTVLSAILLLELTAVLVIQLMNRNSQSSNSWSKRV